VIKRLQSNATEEFCILHFRDKVRGFSYNIYKIHYEKNEEGPTKTDLFGKTGTRIYDIYRSGSMKKQLKLDSEH